MSIRLHLYHSLLTSMSTAGKRRSSASISGRRWPLAVILSCGLALTSCGESLLESAAPDAVEITPSSVSLRAGSSTRLSMSASSKGRPVPGVTVAWSSNTPSVATIDNAGLLTGVSRGASQVTVSIPGTNTVGRVPVTVLGVISVVINAASTTLEVGRTQQLTALVTADPGVTPQAVTWTSSNAAIASVSSSGLISAVSAGQVTITASCEGRTTSFSLAVVRPPVATVTLAPASIDLRVGQTSAITATVRDASGTVLTDRTVAWSTSNSSIATIGSSGTTSGTVTAVSPGSATITATVEGVQRTATLTVTPVPDAVSSISVTPTSANLSVGQVLPLNWTVVQPNGAPAATVTLGTSNPSVAVVSASGNITAVAPGTASITVTASAPSSAGFSAKSLTAIVGVTVQSISGCGQNTLAANAFFSATSSANGGCDYVFPSATPRTIRLELSTSAFSPSLFVANGTPPSIGPNSANPLNMELLTVGNTDILVRSTTGVGGPFTLRLSEITLDSSACSTNRYALRGASATRRLSSTDCVSNGFYSDEFFIYLNAGESITIDMLSGEFDTLLKLYDANRAQVALDDDSGDGTNSRLTYRATTAGFYLVGASSYSSGITGTYSISFR
jgi:uncharacterized protein YjdB